MATPTTRIDLLTTAEVEAGEVFCGSLDSPLSAEGMKALKKTVRRRNDWAVVVSSPRPSCTAFAEWLAQKHSIPQQVWPAFREMSFGTWEGRLPGDIMAEDTAILARWWSDPACLTPPEGESFDAFRQRVMAGWSRLLRDHRGKTILMVTHPGVVRLLVSQVLGMPSSHFFRLDVESASLARIRVVHEANSVWTSLESHGNQG